MIRSVSTSDSMCAIRCYRVCHIPDTCVSSVKIRLSIQHKRIEAKVSLCAYYVGRLIKNSIMNKI